MRKVVLISSILLSYSNMFACSNADSLVECINCSVLSPLEMHLLYSGYFNAHHSPKVEVNKLWNQMSQGEVVEQQSRFWASLLIMVHNKSWSTRFRTNYHILNDKCERKMLTYCLKMMDFCTCCMDHNGFTHLTFGWLLESSPGRRRMNKGHFLHY